jgi:hypothetical protein
MHTEIDYRELDRIPDQEPLDQQLANYFGAFYNEEFVDFQPDPGVIGNDVANTQEFVDGIRQEAFTTIARNNEIAQVLSSDEFSEVSNKEKDELRGDCSVGINVCIDGRIPRLFLIGLTGKVWETGAGIVATKESPRDKTEYPQSAKLQESIEERVTKEPSEHLQIMFAHTSLSEQLQLKEQGFPEKPKHCCGAMNMQDLPAGTDLLQENIDMHKNGADAMLNSYNSAAKKNNTEGLKQLGVTAVYDTDTMGIMIGYNTDHQLLTTDITKQALVDGPLREELEALVGSPAQFKDSFTEAQALLPLERQIYAATKFLLDHGEFSTALQTNINALNPDLTEKQLKAFQYVLSRNMAFQYLSGVYDGSHAFTDHGEEYLAGSKEGVIVGAFDPEAQSFGFSVGSSEEGNAHAIIGVNIMNAHPVTVEEKGEMVTKKKRKFYFVSKAVSDNQTNGSLERSRASLREFFEDTLDDPEIFEMIKSGELIPVPVSVHDRTHEILRVHNFA